MKMEISKRIQYIDAMRGFTMFLVVLAHCGTYCMGQYDGNVYFRIFQAFRMPLFFFVSGFVFYKESSRWDRLDIAKFINKKISVQILSPLLFMVVYCYLNDINLIDGIRSPLKVGYWFTFTLFAFFMIYILTERITYLFKCIRIENRVNIHMGVAILFIVIFHERVISFIGFKDYFDIMGMTQWYFYFYFILGVWTKKNFAIFQRVLDKSSLLVICIVVFFILLLCEDYTQIPGVSYIALIIKAIAGIVIVFSFFRKHENVFDSTTKIGTLMQFIGRRTLDIYIIHYLVLPKGLSSILSYLKDFEIPMIELLVAALLATLVIALSLIISSVLRLSPTLSHFLFGSKC